MPWIKVDDHFDEHLKHARVGPPGWGYWLAGLAYCNRNLTDGFIPYAVAYSLAGWQVWDDVDDDARERIWTYGVASGMSGQDLDGEWIVARLVASGLWEPAAGGFMVHDYLDYNPSRESVLAERKVWAEKKARGRMSHRESPGDSMGESSPSPSRPVPVPVPVPVPEVSNETSSSGGADLFDLYYRLTVRTPSKAVMDWLDRLQAEHGAETVALAMSMAWAESPNVKDFLGRVEMVCVRADKKRAEDDKDAAKRRAEDERRREREELATMPEEQRNANMARLKDMLRTSGLVG